MSRRSTRPWPRWATPDLATAKAEARTRGKYLGLGLSTYIEVCGVAPSKWIGAVGEGWGAAMWESANLRVHLTGKVVLTMGTQPQGQGHETTYAQIIAHELGIPMDDVVVQHSDTQGTPFGYGSYGSRTSSVGGTAAVKAAGKIREKARAYAAHMLEASVDDIEVEGAEYRVKGSPDKKKTIQEIAFALDLGFSLPEGMEPYLDETVYHDTPNCTWPFGTHVAVVEIDEETGKVDLVRYVAVDDVGKKINPMIVDGQLHGGIVQGVGQALWEGAIYGQDGQLLSGSMLDYALPRASWLPNLELDETVTPVAGQPARGQGRGRGRRHRQHGRGRQRRHRRARPVRAAPPRHALHAADRVAGDARREGRPGMIPASFDYVRPASLDEALGLLGDDGTKIIAGGQSLLPLMKLRLARPERLVDIGGAERRCAASAASPTAALAIGGLTRYVDLMGDPAVAAYTALADALPSIGDVQVRNRGTIGGALAHCDPASDLPAVLLAFDAQVVARSRRGERTIALADFFHGPFQTALAADEILTEVRLPAVAPGLSARRTSRSSRRPRASPSPGAAVVLGRRSGGAVRPTRAGRPDRRRRRSPYRAAAVEQALADGADAAARRGARHRRPAPSTPTSTPMRPTGPPIAAVVVRRAIEAARARLG